MQKKGSGHTHGECECLLTGNGIDTMSACLTGAVCGAAALANVADHATTATKTARSTSALEQREAAARMVASKDDGASHNLQTGEMG
jgi:hypothetical protein